MDDQEPDVRITVESVAVAIDVSWKLLAAVMVFFMQGGFAMLEVGSVSIKNTKNILIKNIGDSSLGAIAWWLFGHALAFGADSRGFVGTSGFALKGEDLYGTDSGIINVEGYTTWIFEWAFAATSATIVSGAMAERATFGAYVMHSFIITSFIYPFGAHWAWSDEGWASASNSENLLFGCGVVDFAGSGVVHVTGGMAALVGVIVLGPRYGRFNQDRSYNTMPQQSAVLQTLGTLMLWWGWLGFNGGSIESLVGMPGVAAKVLCVTVIGGAAGGISALVTHKLREGYWDTVSANNGILAGLVSITAGCGTFEPEGAFVVGAVGGVLFFFSELLLLKMNIDDVVSATPVHLFCGVWGLLAAGLFSTKFGYAAAYDADRSDSCAGVFYGGDGRTLAANTVFAIALLGWVGLMTFVLFVTVKLTIGIRVSKNVEEIGMDIFKHGGAAYPEMRLAALHDAKTEDSKTEFEL